MNNARDEQHRFAKQYNTYDLSGKYGKGWTHKGEEFWFDLEDYDKIKDYCWHFNQWGHLISTERGGKKRIFLHRLVMEPIPDGMVVDHIQHPAGRALKQDNRKSNLRIVTQRENSLNRYYNSPHPGITKRNNKWIVRITVAPYVRKIIGTFNTLEEAIQAQSKAKQELLGGI